MRLQQTLEDASYWFKQLLVDYSAKRSFGYILLVARVVSLLAAPPRTHEGSGNRSGIARVKTRRVRPFSMNAS